MATVVSTTQLSQVAAAQKAYIDAKDKENKDAIDAQKTDLEAAMASDKQALEKQISDQKTELQTAIDAIVVPDEASAEEISEITDLFAVAQA